MTVNDVLHKLWSNSKGSDFEHFDEKRLWMLLQNFIERHGGCSKSAQEFDVRGGSTLLDDIKPRKKPPKGLKAKIKRLFEPPTMG